MSLVRARSRSGLVALAVGALLVAAVTAPVADLLHSPDAASAAPALAATELPSPAVTSLETGRLDVFTRSSGGDLLHRYRPAGGSWTRTVNLGGDLASQPAAVAWAPGRLDVFVRGTDDQVWQRTLTVAGGWGGWVALGGTVTSAPAATSWGPGRLDVFVRGTDSGLWKRSFSGGGWTTWQRLAGTLTSSPAAATWGSGRLDVFVRGTDNGLWQRSYTGAAWSAWIRLGGTLASQPAATSAGDGVIDVAVRGPDQLVHVRRFTRGAGWGGWTAMGGALSSGLGATSRGGVVTIVGLSPNGNLYEKVRGTSGTWTGWIRIDPYAPFRRLGTWVDVFDYAALDPATAVPAMRSAGVRVLYLSTARFNGTTDLFDATEAGQWLDIAHQNGIAVVGWYLPAYGDMARDVRRTVAIARFVSPGGQRFDAVGVDVERLDEVTLAQFNSLLVTHLAQVRAQVDAMVAAIVPSPFATDPGNRWEGFPWAAVGSNSDVVVPMALWSFRSNADGSAFTADQVYLWVLDQTRRARSLTGRPVTVEGGVDDPGTERTPITADRVSRFVDAVVDGGAIGGSHYDYATTGSSLWAVLSRLNGL